MECIHTYLSNDEILTTLMVIKIILIISITIPIETTLLGILIVVREMQREQKKSPYDRNYVIFEIIVTLRMVMFILPMDVTPAEIVMVLKAEHPPNADLPYDNGNQ